MVEILLLLEIRLTSTFQFQRLFSSLSMGTLMIGGMLQSHTTLSSFTQKTSSTTLRFPRKALEIDHSVYTSERQWAVARLSTEVRTQWLPSVTSHKQLFTTGHTNANCRRSGFIKGRSYRLRCLGGSRKPRLGLGEHVRVLQEVVDSDIPQSRARGQV